MSTPQRLEFYPRTGVHELPRPLNAGTCTYEMVPPPIERGLVEHCEEAAERILRGLGPRGDGYLLHASNGVSSVTRHLSGRELDYLVVGRHTQCDVLVSDDPGVALRHVLARIGVTPDGEPSLELRTLGAHMPMRMMNGAGHAVIAGAGRVVVELGSYVLVGLPMKRGVDAGDPRGRGGPYRGLPMACEVRHVGEIETLSGFVPRPHGAVGRLVIEAAGQREEVWITGEELRGGVLVGRYSDRCLGDRIALPNEISRLHLLLIGEADRPVAYDLCSMNGTQCQGRAVRAQMLGATRPILILGCGGRVAVQWHAE